MPDTDLNTLAAVIAEYKLENNAAGWFELPWRDGWAAAELAQRAFWRTTTPARVNGSGPVGILISSVDRFLHANTGYFRNSAYADADDLLAAIIPLILINGLDEVRFLTAALRCAQVTLANSSGGGHVYNGILQRPFEIFKDPEHYASIVLDARCKDAIGVGVTLAGDADDRLRRAFRIAWERGLYRAAYAIPRAKGAVS